MPKQNKVEPSKIEEKVMEKVMSGGIKMKPRWYFVVGSIASIVGITSLSIGMVFVVNLTLFLARKHGPMGEFRLQQLLNSFPWWLPVLICVGLVSGILLLRRYDFSYKRNFWAVVGGLVISLILAGWIINVLGLNDVWSRGPMRRLYPQIERQNTTEPREKGQGRGRGRNQIDRFGNGI